MTSTIRVSEIKRRKGSKLKNFDGRPREGTRLREAYDRLRRGDVIAFRRSRDYHRQLTDFYGMEIERVEPGRYRLLGEWIGSEYIPVERLTVSLMETAQ